MCCNYALSRSERAFYKQFGYQLPDGFSEEFYPFRPTKKGTPAKPYNFAPIVLPDEDGRRTVRRMRWGLLPHWSKTDQDPIQPFNAQAEGVETKRMFSAPLEKRRCLVPSSGFFEFQSVPTGKKRLRFSVADDEFFAFAGLWNRFDDELSTFTFITTAPSEWFSQFHNRQAVILRPDDYDRWLDPGTPIEELRTLFTPWAGELATTPAPKSSSLAKLLAQCLGLIYFFSFSFSWLSFNCSAASTSACCLVFCSKSFRM